jgi:hypothetical protein
MEGDGRGLIEVLSQHLPGETEEYHERVRGVPVEIRTEHRQNTTCSVFVLFQPLPRCYMTILSFHCGMYADIRPGQPQWLCSVCFGITAHLAAH